MPDVRIVGGKSSRRRVSIISDEFTATARLEKNGDITSTVKRHWSLTRFLYQNNHLPIPRLIRTLVFLLDGMTTKGRVFLGLFVLLQLLPLNSTFPSSNLSEQFWWLPYVILGLTVAGALLYVRRRIATWHGAEHMAIAAYDHTSSTDHEVVARENPIHDKCGGRFFLPGAAGIIIAYLAAQTIGLNQTLVFAVILECALWVDTLVGWEKIPSTALASHLLQRWVTTRSPGEQELRTAQRALQELLAAHHAKV